MWVDSKTAAAVLGVSNRAIQKACANSKFFDKKICTIKSKILNFSYQDNSRGGASGKVLQIWLDDELERKNYENKEDNRVNALVGEQGIQSEFNMSKWEYELKSKETGKNEKKGCVDEQSKELGKNSVPNDKTECKGDICFSKAEQCDMQKQKEKSLDKCCEAGTNGHTLDENYKGIEYGKDKEIYTKVQRPSA
ncbi:hypothetical protein, partial [Campylobacter fetus]|uniref:hypothetical protein n=1 Tax=Campylobacter fetus TaxID=196 RepID=UPI0013D4CAD6